MKITFLVPVFNEEKTIGQVLKKLTELKLPHKLEIIVVDDGSTDNTIEEIRKIKSPLIRFFPQLKNKGKGAAIKTGLKYATGDFVLIQDADLEYNPEEVQNLLKPILENVNKIAVFGSRFKENHAQIPPIYLLGNKLLTLITNILYGTNLSDMETGYKLLPRSFIKKNRFKSDRFDIEPEITSKLIKNKYKIIEVPITYKGRNHFAGKKLTIRDAYGAIKALVYFRFFD